MGQDDTTRQIAFIDYTSPPCQPFTVASLARNAMQLAGEEEPMHYTLRVALQRGTPVDDIAAPHVWTETETLDDAIASLAGITAEAETWRDRHPNGTADSLILILMARQGNEFEQGDEPHVREAFRQREILSSVREARQRVQLVYDAGMGENDELGEALATLDQISRWLTGEEVPT